MQPPSPAPPPPPPAVPAPTGVVLLPDGPVPLSGLPRTAQEVEGLRARREVLSDQLSRATNRRSQLVSQLNRGTAEEGRAGVQQRLNLLDERILQIERDQALTERLLSSAAPEVLASTTQARREPQSNDEVVVFTGMGAFGLGVVLTLLLGRLRRRRQARRGAHAPGAAALPDDPRFDHINRALEAIAEEVERIGEGQRFVTQLLANRRDAMPVLSGDADRR